MSDCCCSTDLKTNELQRCQRRVLAIVLTINAATFVLMVAGSVLSGSSSLLSGALDNLGDALTYAISFAVVGASVLAKARVAFLKGLFILGAAVAVAGQILWRLSNPDVPVVETMGIAASLNLVANAACLMLLYPHRHTDVNMASVWECSRNDVVEGIAVILTALMVWIMNSGWPDIVVAIALLFMFARSATRVLRRAMGDMRNTEAAA